MRYIAVDPGLEGGLAVLDILGGARTIIDVISVPTTGTAAKRRVDAGIVCDFIIKMKPEFGVIERAQAMPKQGSSSGFIYGRAVGALEACLEACLVPHIVIESTAWKKFHGLIKTDKEDSRQKALKLFPAHPALLRKMDHNRAEAVLMACYAAAISDQRLHKAS